MQTEENASIYAKSRLGLQHLRRPLTLLGASIHLPTLESPSACVFVFGPSPEPNLCGPKPFSM